MRSIDAGALIAEMHNVILEDGEDRRTFYEVIERQPTIEIPQWILVTEGMPEEGENVLVSVSLDKRLHGKYEIYHRFVTIGYISHGEWKEDAETLIEADGETFVTAWLPLPSTYDKDKGITCGDCDWYDLTKNICIESYYWKKAEDTVACEYFEPRLED